MSSKITKLWPIVADDGVIAGASPAPEDAVEYLTWDDWWSLQGRPVRYDDIKWMMKKKSGGK